MLIFVQSADVCTVVSYSICSRSLVAFGSVVADAGLVARARFLIAVGWSVRAHVGSVRTVGMPRGVEDSVVVWLS